MVNYVLNLFVIKLVNCLIFPSNGQTIWDSHNWQENIKTSVDKKNY